MDFYFTITVEGGYSSSPTLQLDEERIINESDEIAYNISGMIGEMIKSAYTDALRKQSEEGLRETEEESNE
jgi:hypothetical protein